MTRPFTATLATVVLPLLLDRRIQVVAALVLTLVGSLLLGVDTTEAGPGVIGSGGHR
ncbi:MAG: hypothetical protein U0031_16850 [Thermomicrobiales bacterium]